jgi:hypothetical protein
LRAVGIEPVAEIVSVAQSIGGQRLELRFPGYYALLSSFR